MLLCFDKIYLKEYEEQYNGGLCWIMGLIVWVFSVLKWIVGLSFIIILRIENSMPKQAGQALWAINNSSSNPKDTKPCQKIKNIEKNNISGQTKHLSFESKEQDQDSHPQSQNDAGFQTIGQQLDLLQEHKKVVEQLFFECSSTFNQSSIKDKQKNNYQTVIFKSITLHHYFSILLQRLRQIKPQLVALFTSFIRVQRNSHHFLQHLYYSYPAQTVHHVFKYIFFIWQLYYPFLGSIFNLEEKINISQKISTKIYQRQITVKMHLNNRNEQDRKALRKLIKRLTITLVLVMQKCPTNPYLSQIHKLNQQQNTELQHDCKCRKLLKGDE